MAYYIFLKSFRSLEEFRKNPHVKIPPKSPYANFQSLGVFKNQFLFGKEFSPSLSAHPAFRPNLLFSFTRRFSSPPPTGPRPSGQHSPPHGPTGRHSPPHAFFLLPHRRRWSTPRRLPGRPDAPTGREKWSHLFHPINRCHSHPLQSRKLAPSTPPLKLLQDGH
jgi:hypothetical protein